MIMKYKKFEIKHSKDQPCDEIIYKLFRGKKKVDFPHPLPITYLKILKL